MDHPASSACLAPVLRRNLAIHKTACSSKYRAFFARIGGAILHHDNLVVRAAAA